MALTFIILLGLVLLLLSGMPIFAGLGLASIILMLLTEGSIGSVGDTVFGKLDNGLLSAIPLFAFMAHVMIRAKVVDDLYEAANSLVGHFPAGLLLRRFFPAPSLPPFPDHPSPPP